VADNIIKDSHSIFTSLQKTIALSLKDNENSYDDEDIAEVLGISLSTLRNKKSEKTSTHVFSIKDAIAIMKITENYSFLRLLARHFGYEINESSGGDKEEGNLDVMEAFLELENERGQTAEVIKEAIYEKGVNNKTLENIEKEMAQDFHKEQELLQRIENYKLRK